MRITRRMKIWTSQIELVWAAVVLLGMLVHNNWQLIAIRTLQYQLIAIWRLQYNLIAIWRSQYNLISIWRLQYTLIAI
jgi:hypothetical protein